MRVSPVLSAITALSISLSGCGAFSPPAEATEPGTPASVITGLPLPDTDVPGTDMPSAAAVAPTVTLTPLAPDASDLLSLMFARDEVADGFQVEPDLSGVLTMDELAALRGVSYAEGLRALGVLEIYQLSYRKTISVVRSWSARFPDDGRAHTFLANYSRLLGDVRLEEVEAGPFGEQSRVVRYSSDDDEAVTYEVLIRVRNVAGGVLLVFPGDRVNERDVEEYAAQLEEKMRIRLLGEILNATPTRASTRVPTVTCTPADGSVTPPVSSCACDRDRYSCADFDSRAEAEACFAACKEQGVGDVHGLDPNGDGLICPLLQ
ncbi:MAG: hypothetical protein IT326_03470 [Anaerolineae bacterium]|nr:hypothetical protein [Anaerolineae bacterium]